MMPDKIERLHHQLSLTLPGADAQMKMAPDFRGEFYAEPPQQPAAVLILIYSQNNSWYTILVKRTEYEGHHSGQISLPGGKFEPGDKNIMNTSLRETSEETGIKKHEFRIIGQLTPLIIPVSNFKVYPFVGYAEKKPDFYPDLNEVEYIIEVDLHLLIQPETRKITYMNIRGHRVKVPYFDYNGNQIWGATAMMLSEFLEILEKSEFSAGQK